MPARTTMSVLAPPGVSGVAVDDTEAVAEADGVPVWLAELVREEEPVCDGEAVRVPVPLDDEVCVGELVCDGDGVPVELLEPVAVCDGLAVAV